MTIKMFLMFLDSFLGKIIMFEKLENMKANYNLCIVPLPCLKGKITIAETPVCSNLPFCV